MRVRGSNSEVEEAVKVKLATSEQSNKIRKERRMYAATGIMHAFHQPTASYSKPGAL